MEQGIIHSNNANIQVNGSNNHTGYTAIDASHIDHHHDQDDNAYPFPMKAAEDEENLR
jgi:hypothetical protein